MATVPARPQYPLNDPAADPPRITKSPAKDVDRTPEFRWLRQKGQDYLGEWVALSGDELVAHSKTLKELLAELEKKNLTRKPLIHKVD